MNYKLYLKIYDEHIYIIYDIWYILKTIYYINDIYYINYKVYKNTYIYIWYFETNIIYVKYI